ncbi:MAG: ABC transporter permease [archaeon]|jgi:ABC-type nitrate/sulfonate/bicarbonate transport system permease component
MVEKHLLKWMGAVFAAILFISIWATFAMLFNSFIFPGPLEVFESLITLIFTGEIFPHILATLNRAIIGFLLGLILGSTLGYLTGMNKYIDAVLKPIIELLRPIPPIAWIPLAILWFGIGDASAFFIIFLASFFPVFTSVYFGVTSLPIVCERVSKNYSLTFSQKFVHIVFPFSVPYLINGCKTAIGWAWMCVIAAEIIASSQGLGYFIEINRFSLNTSSVISAMLIIGVIGLILQKVIQVIETKLTSWRSVSHGE